MILVDAVREVCRGIGVGVEACFPRKTFDYERFQQSSSVPVSSVPGAAELPAGDGRRGPAPAGHLTLTLDEIRAAVCALKYVGEHALARKFEAVGYALMHDK
jgi:hypothetical protein